MLLFIDLDLRDICMAIVIFFGSEFDIMKQTRVYIFRSISPWPIPAPKKRRVRGGQKPRFAYKSNYQ